MELRGKGAERLVWVEDAASDRAARALAEHGVVGIRGGLPDWQPLAAHVDALLEEAIVLAEGDDEAEGELFGTVLARDCRWDLKLLLTPPVATALGAVVGRCRGLLEHVATEAAHPDTQLPDDGGMPLYTVFVALQDIAAADGPLGVAPGTHTIEEHDRLRDGKFEGAGVETAEVTCAGGDAYVIDSRVWHRGGANVGQRRRRVFYASFRAPCSSPPGSSYSLRGELHNRLRLSAL